MTTAHFAVFDIADFTGTERLGDILVATDGTITVSTRAGSPSAKRLNTAVDVLRKSSSLDLRSESMLGGSLVMKIHETHPGKPLYAAAVTDTLSWSFGFRCTRQ